MLNTKLILETGCNHQGSIDIAQEMIQLAAKANAWGIKFQKRDIESIPDNIKKKQRDLSNSFGLNYYDHRKALEFSIDQLSEMKNYAESMGLVFLCSAFDEKSINDLLDMDCKYIKLPSQLYSRDDLQIQLLKARETQNFKIIVSTGMHEEDEIFTSRWMNEADIVMHCISYYPVDDESFYNMITLLRMQRIRAGKSCGYSSHGLNGEDVFYATLAGAEYIERHFTLCKNLKGSDHGTVSSDYDEIIRIKDKIREAEIILGTDRICSGKEIIVRQIYRGF